MSGRGSSLSCVARFEYSSARWRYWRSSGSRSSIRTRRAFRRRWSRTHSSCACWPSSPSYSVSCCRASATGSIGFIPYFAAAIVVPAWPSVACVVLVKSIVELWQRRAPIKALLNVSSHAIMELVAVGTYLLLGGMGLESIPDVRNLTHVTAVAGLPALVAFVAALATNNLIVAVAIAIDKRTADQGCFAGSSSGNDWPGFPRGTAGLRIRMGVRSVWRDSRCNVLGADPRPATDPTDES